jgi:hypothetical protein
MGGMKSLAQMRRNDGLVEAGTITREVFDRDLLETDVASIPWRVGPNKPTDPGEEEIQAIREKFVAKKAELLAAQASAAETAALPSTPAAEPYNPQGEGLQDGGEGLEAGRPIK